MMNVLHCSDFGILHLVKVRLSFLHLAFVLFQEKIESNIASGQTFIGNITVADEISKLRCCPDASESLL